MQPTPSTPGVVMNHAGDRKQVPLRDYLNSRIAPFLKKAMTQSLEVEAEYPLQWLGECLINQSILYEGNPDPTNIKERFRYNFDAPPAIEQVSTETEMNGTETASAPEPVAASAPVSETPASEPIPGQTMTNGEPAAGTENAQTTEEVKVQAEEGEVHAQDTVMGGTS